MCLSLPIFILRGELGPWTADLSASNHERPFDRLPERSIGVRKADRANGENLFRNNLKTSARYYH